MGEDEGSRDVCEKYGTRVPAVPPVRSASCVAALKEEDETGDMEELCFGETKEKVVGACHEWAVRGYGHTGTPTVKNRRGAYQSPERVGMREPKSAGEGDDIGYLGVAMMYTVRETLVH